VAVDGRREWGHEKLEQRLAVIMNFANELKVLKRNMLNFLVYLWGLELIRGSIYYIEQVDWGFNYNQYKSFSLVKVQPEGKSDFGVD